MEQEQNPSTSEAVHRLSRSVALLLLVEQELRSMVPMKSESGKVFFVIPLGQASQQMGPIQYRSKITSSHSEEQDLHK